MNTVSSNNSLILFANNRNRSNVYPTDTADIPAELFLANRYIHLFKEISQEIQNSKKPKVSIVDLWKQYCEAECKLVRNQLISTGTSNSEEDIEKVVNKFRGNAGEIFVEMMMTNGLCSDICENGSYVPVEDPAHERYVDGECISPRDGLPSGIQIKNYNSNLVNQEIFMKAAAEAALWMLHDRRISDEELVEYTKTPHQYVISFTDTNEFNPEDFKGVVLFLGPSWIDGRGIQGDWKNGLPGNYRIFSKVVKEIEEFCSKFSKPTVEVKKVQLMEAIQKPKKNPIEEIECDIFENL